MCSALDFREEITRAFISNAMALMVDQESFTRLPPASLLWQLEPQNLVGGEAAFYSQAKWLHVV